MDIDTPFCIGHRGAKGHVAENTLASFEKAIAFGCPWIELDVHAVEEELIVIHDREVDRTTNGTGRIKELSLGYIRSLDAGGGEKIPTLSEVLDLVDRRARINVELKGKGTAARVSELLNGYLEKDWQTDDFLLSSFNHTELMQADPRYRRGALFDKLTDDMWEQAEHLEAWSVNVDKKDVSQSLVTEAHNRGFKVLVYTVNKEAVIRKMLGFGVDGIFSDYPDRVIALLAER